MKSERQQHEEKDRAAWKEGRKDLEDVVFNDFIKNDFISEGDGQVASGLESLSDPVALETEEQTLEREKNERDVLFIAHKFSTGWSVGVVKSEKKKMTWSFWKASISQKRTPGLKN